MSLSIKQKILIFLVAILPILIVGSSCLYPPEIRYSSYLTPVVFESNPAYSLDPDTGATIFQIGDSVVEVKYMTESELNALFPDSSSQGIYSTNPYTYGNWVDPDLGYIPNRFTVFEVTSINRSFAKMKIDPVEVVLTTDLGETLNSYTFSVAAAKYGNSFENYYRSVRGMSGNEYYRHEMRLGNLRGKNFGLDEIIFRGDSYSGLISFDKLNEDVKRVQLIINDIVFRFDAFNRPADTITATFSFERKIDKVVITREMQQQELEKQKVRVGLTGPQLMVYNRVNDNDRTPMAVDRILQENVEKIESCFIERFRRNQVEEGRMVLSFNIGIDGTIVSQNVIESSGINSESFMNCVLDVVQEMKFNPIIDMPLEGSNIVKGPAEVVNVLYPLTFTMYIDE
ncbi:AgmX/PglI C-terminal domain-containing protein [Candidatus Latescibacterota bacterium]